MLWARVAKLWDLNFIGAGDVLRALIFGVVHYLRVLRI